MIAITPVFLTRTPASTIQSFFFNQTIIRNQHAAVGEFSQQSYIFYFTSTHINRYRMVEREKERATHTEKKRNTQKV